MAGSGVIPSDWDSSNLGKALQTPSYISKVYADNLRRCLSSVESVLGQAQSPRVRTRTGPDLPAAVELESGDTAGGRVSESLL